jgi:4-hydroxybenzoate polyprenyltransferase
MNLFLRITRPINLLLTVLTQLLFYISASRITSGLSGIDFSNIRFPEALSATFACVFIAAGGYVINDIFDKDTDSINKPQTQIAHSQIAAKSLYIYYIILSTVGLLLGFYTGLGMGILCIAIAVLLYFYSSDFKGEYLMGNLLVSLLAGMVVYIASRGVYEVSKAYFAEYASIAFFITFARELVKDLEDIKGDSAEGHTTFAITMGAKYTKMLASIMLIIGVAILGIIYYHSGELVFLMSSTTIALPFLILILVKLRKAQKAEDYSFISKHLKQLMFLGLLTSLFC